MVTKLEALDIWNMANREDRTQILNLASEIQFSKLTVEALKSKVNSSFSPPANLVIVTLVRKWLK